MIAIVVRNIVLVASMFSVGSAFAADLPIRKAPAFVSSTFAPGFYVFGGGGVLLPGTTNARERDCGPMAITLCGSVNPVGDSDGWSVMGAVGYRFNPWFRGDIGVGYSRVDAAGSRAALPGEGGSPSYSADFRTTVIMATGYLEFAGLFAPRTFGVFEPFVGAGIGGARVDVSNLSFSNTAVANTFFLPEGEETKLAWKLTAGTGIRVAPRWRIDVAYAYYDLGTVNTEAGAVTSSPPFGPLTTSGFNFRARSHSIETGIRYDF